jgi:hypothetical protein
MEQTSTLEIERNIEKGRMREREKERSIKKLL